MGNNSSRFKGRDDITRHGPSGKSIFVAIFLLLALMWQFSDQDFSNEPHIKGAPEWMQATGYDTVLIGAFIIFVIIVVMTTMATGEPLGFFRFWINLLFPKTEYKTFTDRSGNTHTFATSYTPTQAELESGMSYSDKMQDKKHMGYVKIVLFIAFMLALGFPMLGIFLETRLGISF